MSQGTPDRGGPTQKAYLQALPVDSKGHNMVWEMEEKDKVTLQLLAPFDILVQWWDDLYRALKQVSLYIEVCWLKTAGGALCTLVRLHTVQSRTCIFGRPDSCDDLCRYLVSPEVFHNSGRFH